MLLTLNDVAKHLACSRRTVRRLIDSGALSIVALTMSSKGDRIEESELADFIQRRKRNRGISLGRTSGHVVAFGTRVPKSATSELDALLGKGQRGRKRNSTNSKK